MSSKKLGLVPRFPKRYENDWRIPNRYVYIYMFEEEPIWGMTAEIICDFIK